ncbi:hypothetical protein DB346_22085 [Verrucomicrobia bacterium LW23]|nr:hypothetical protein DB346_22085 [Verrucomicrobia bacterium LW23]
MRDPQVEILQRATGEAYVLERGKLLMQKDLRRSKVLTAGASDDELYEVTREILRSWSRAEPTIRAALEEIAREAQVVQRQSVLQPDAVKLAARLSRKHGARRMALLGLEILWKGAGVPSGASADAVQFVRRCAAAMSVADAGPAQTEALLALLRAGEADPVVAQCLADGVRKWGSNEAKAELQAILAVHQKRSPVSDPENVSALESRASAVGAPPSSDEWRVAERTIVPRFKVERADLEEAVRQLNGAIRKEKGEGALNIMLLLNKQDANTYELSRSLSASLDGKSVAEIVRLLCALSGHSWRVEKGAIVIYAR